MAGGEGRTREERERERWSVRDMEYMIASQFNSTHKHLSIVNLFYVVSIFGIPAASFVREGRHLKLRILREQNGKQSLLHDSLS